MDGSCEIGEDGVAANQQHQRSHSFEGLTAHSSTPASSEPKNLRQRQTDVHAEALPYRRPQMIKSPVPNFERNVGTGQISLSETNNEEKYQRILQDTWPSDIDPLRNAEFHGQFESFRTPRPGPRHYGEQSGDEGYQQRHYSRTEYRKSPSNQAQVVEKRKPVEENNGEIVKIEKKEKKSITTKTFAHGMMDVSLLTSNATQLRSVLSNNNHEFYNLLIWFIGLSICLQILSGIILIMSDFYKTQDANKDRIHQKRRKLLNFVALALISLITALNILISAFYSPVHQEVVKKEVQPTFASSEYTHSQNHTEL